MALDVAHGDTSVTTMLWQQSADVSNPLVTLHQKTGHGERRLIWKTGYFITQSTSWLGFKQLKYTCSHVHERVCENPFPERICIFIVHITSVRNNLSDHTAFLTHNL